MAGALTALELQFAPISNRLGDWLWQDAEIKPLLAHSNLYMIGQRRELLFEGLSINAEKARVDFRLRCGELSTGDLFWNLPAVLTEADELDIDSSPRHLRFTRTKDNKVLRWFTPDRILWEHHHGTIEVANLSNGREFWNFKLHYVGISKGSDSFSRLFQDGHKNRTRILSQIEVFDQNSHPSDEIMIFLFRLERMEIHQITLEHESRDGGPFSEPVALETYIADAEKALVHVLRPEYNSQRYESYPRGIDGLFGSEMERYGYVITDPLRFETVHEHYRGGPIFCQDVTERGDGVMVSKAANNVRTVRGAGNSASSEEVEQ